MHWLPGLLTLSVLIPLHSVIAAPVLRSDTLEARQEEPSGRNGRSSSAQQFGNSPARSSSRNRGGQGRSNNVNGARQSASKQTGQSRQNRQNGSSSPKSKSRVKPRQLALAMAREKAAEKAAAKAAEKAAAKAAARQRQPRGLASVAKAGVKGLKGVKAKGPSADAPRSMSATTGILNPVPAAPNAGKMKSTGGTTRYSAANKGIQRNSSGRVTGSTVQSKARTGDGKPKPKSGATRTNAMQKSGTQRSRN